MKYKYFLFSVKLLPNYLPYRKLAKESEHNKSKYLRGFNSYSNLTENFSPIGAQKNNCIAKHYYSQFKFFKILCHGQHSFFTL